MLHKEGIPPFDTFPPIPQYGRLEDEDMHNIRMAFKYSEYKTRRHGRFILGAAFAFLLGFAGLLVSANYFAPGSNWSSVTEVDPKNWTGG